MIKFKLVDVSEAFAGEVDGEPPQVILRGTRAYVRSIITVEEGNTVHVYTPASLYVVPEAKGP